MTTLKYQLERGECVRWLTDGPNHPPATPSEWFCRRYPAETKRWGCPFLEAVIEEVRNNQKLVTPVSMNDLFFASILSDRQLGHSVVFFDPEQQWYFLEPRDHQYHLTSEAKLINLLSALLMKCAEEMPDNVDKYNLAVKFREVELLSSIVKKARSLLAADASFFSVDSPHKRIGGIESHASMTRRFLKAAVKPQPGNLLSVQQCFEEFSQYCRNNDHDPVERRAFKQLIIEAIREEFGLGLRTDLKNAEGRYQRGWKGLALETADRSLKDQTGCLN